MLITIETPNTLPSESDLQILEEKYAVTIPDEYREFLLIINGGTPNHRDELNCTIHWDGQEWADEEEQAGINYFYHIGTQGDEVLGLDLDSNIQIFVLEKRIPIGTIPIANDAGGNQYIISSNEKDYGHVYYWLMDFEKNSDDPVEADFSNVAVVAESFSQFMNSFEILE